MFETSEAYSLYLSLRIYKKRFHRTAHTCRDFRSLFTGSFSAG